MSKGRNDKTFEVARGASVFVHQAFRCCPYAAVITSKIHDFLEANAYAVCDKPEEAAAVVINTCGFNASRSNQALRTIKLIRKRAPRAPMVVSGCLTRIERRRVARALSGCRGAVMIGPKEHAVFDKIFRPGKVRFRDVQTNLYKDRYSSRDPRLGLYQILVSTGCMNKCRYCVINKAKGRVESKRLDDVIGEVGRGLELGYRDIFLVGDDLSCYGMDAGKSVVDLLEALVRVEGDGRYSAEAFEPSGFMRHMEGLLPALSTGRFAWIVFPVQSGSDRVLKAMGRSYTRRAVEEAVSRLRAAAPGMILSTDFIFGYPSETMEDFEASIDHARLFDYANFNEYEQRPGTPPADISQSDMEPRRKIVLDFLRDQGSQEEVLTQNRVLPYDAWTGKDDDAETRRKTVRWTAEASGRFKRMLHEGGGIELGPSWKIVRVDEDRSGVVFTAEKTGTDETMRLLLTKRSEDAPCMAYSDEYNLSLISEETLEGIDRSRIEALTELGRILGLTQG
jgi:threonylcarbamoyladenosine tRNA methylthiotransferase CDKAL1